MNPLKMMGQMQEAQKKMDEAKQRLENITIDGKAYEDGVIVTLNGNRKVKNVSVTGELLNDKTKLEDMLVLAVNRAIEKADSVNETEMQSAAKEMLPGMGGLFK